MKLPQCSVTQSGQTTRCAQLGCSEKHCRSLGGYNPLPIEVDETKFAPFSPDDWARIEGAVQAGFERAAHDAHQADARARRTARDGRAQQRITPERETLDGWASTLSRVREARAAARGGTRRSGARCKAALGR